MRMWMVNPKKMCRKHLLGEHVELHMLVGSILKSKNLDGFIKNNLVQLDKINDRHSELVKEMEHRGYKHKSQLPDFDLTNYAEYGNIDSTISQCELFSRCVHCRELNHACV